MAGKVGWATRLGEKAFHRFNLGPRLTLGFLFTVMALLVGTGVLLWQSYEARVQADRLSAVDQELIAVLQVHTNLMSFCQRLDVLAQS